MLLASIFIEIAFCSIVVLFCVSLIIFFSVLAVLIFSEKWVIYKRLKIKGLEKQVRKRIYKKFKAKRRKDREKRKIAVARHKRWQELRSGKIL